MKAKKVIEILIYIIIFLVTICCIVFLVRSSKILSIGENNSFKFNIERYISSVDKDQDGIDDQTDILNNAKEYIARKPIYKSKYYDTGYSNDEYGVCTDVIAISLLNSGYDLRELVNEDILLNREQYNIEKTDKNIDFRRVRNLNIYFTNTAISLTTDIYQIEEWQPGDIVVINKHIGIISDRRNNKGIPYVIHHANPFQKRYEEDILEYWIDSIIGHYRIS